MHDRDQLFTDEFLGEGTGTKVLAELKLALIHPSGNSDEDKLERIQNGRHLVASSSVSLRSGPRRNAYSNIQFSVHTDYCGSQRVNIAVPGETDRGKTVTKPLAFGLLGLAWSEKQIPQMLEKIRSVENQEERLERVSMRVKQAL